MTETVTQSVNPKSIELRSMFEEGWDVLKKFDPSEQDFYDFITDYDCHTHEKMAYVLGSINMDLLNAIAIRSLANKAKLDDERGDIA